MILKQKMLIVVGLVLATVTAEATARRPWFPRIRARMEARRVLRQQRVAPVRRLIAPVRTLRQVRRRAGCGGYASYSTSCQGRAVTQPVVTYSSQPVVTYSSQPVVTYSNPAPVTYSQPVQTNFGVRSVCGPGGCQ